jgi:hypothetical protein
MAPIQCSLLIAFAPVCRTAARSTENQVAFWERNDLPASRSFCMQLLYRSCAKSRRVLRDTAACGTVSCDKKTRKTDSYSLRPVSGLPTNDTTQTQRTPKRRGVRSVPIASRVLAGLLSAATHPGHRSLSGFDCPCSSRDGTSAQQRQSSAASTVPVAPLGET